MLAIPGSSNRVRTLESEHRRVVSEAKRVPGRLLKGCWGFVPKTDVGSAKMDLTKEEVEEIDKILKEFPGAGARCEWSFSFLSLPAHANLFHLLGPLRSRQTADTPPKWSGCRLPPTSAARPALLASNLSLFLSPSP